MSRIVSFSILVLISHGTFATNVSWTGNGDGISWSDALNWSNSSVPNLNDDITINCACSIQVSADLEIDGTLTVESGTIVDMGGNNLSIGPNDHNAELTNNGIITNCFKLKVKGVEDFSKGPYITNSGTITTLKFDIGNNNGGGVATNTATGVINVTNTIPDGPFGIDESLHVDGTLCNQGVINVTLGATFHGAILKCGGTINASTIEFEEGKGLPEGGGATGGASDIQNQSFSDGSGCSGSSSTSLIYYVVGGTGGGPNGDDSYTFEQLLSEFGTTDTNPSPQFQIDPLLVSSCGSSAAVDTTPPSISNMPGDTMVYIPDNACNIVVTWIEPLITDNVGIISINSTHSSGDIFSVGMTTVTYTADDAAGNTASASFDITVMDTISPQINSIPSDIVQGTDNSHVSYDFKKKITIDHIKVSGATDLIDFPLLIKITDDDLKSTANGGHVTHSNGYDIIFTASDGSTLLDHQLEKYVASTGEYLAWVRIPVLDHNDDTDIYMIYGNSSISSDQSTTGTWSPDYTAVWHLDEVVNNTANGYKDATANSNHGTGISMALAETAGVIGSAQQFDGTSDYIELTNHIADFSSATTGTISCWFYAEDNYKSPIISMNEGIVNNDRIIVQINPVERLLFRINNNSTTETLLKSNASFKESWFNVAIVQDASSNAKMYIDGIEITSFAVDTNSVYWFNRVDNPSWMAIGADIRIDESVFYKGKIDELRVTTIARSAGWIATEYNNQSDPATFYSIGSEQLNGNLCGAIVNWTIPGATDNCSISSLTSSHNPGDLFPVGTTTVTYTATDVNNNTHIQTFDVTITAISDIPADITQNVDAGSCGAIVTWTVPTSTNDCSNTLTSSHNPGDFFPVGTTTVTYTATDGGSNTDEQTFDITITDNIPPILAGLPADISQNADAGACGALVSWTAPSATDNCSATISSSHNSGNFFPVGTTTVTYTATDGGGNTDVQTFNVTITDNFPPVIAGLPADISQGADAGACGAVVTWAEPTATDNCSVSSLISSHNPGDFFPVGTTTVTYTVTDVNSNTDVQTFNITITDNIPPVIAGLPADISQDVDAEDCGAVVSWTVPTATDNCSVSSLISSHNPGDFFPVGTTTVTYTATDGNSNSDIQTFDITVTDNIPPVIAGLPADISQDVDAGTCGAVVNWTLPTASDNCSISSLSSSHSPGDVFPAGTTTVTYTATDDSGNTDVQSFEITITDNLAPVISGMPSDITQNTDVASCGAIVNWTLPTASDNCSISSLASSHNPGDIFPAGTTTVTYTATDDSGNTDLQSFEVTITDNIAPIISGIPANITQDVDAGTCGAVVNWTLPTASDNCSISSLTSSHNPGDIFPLGTTTVTFTTADDSGNTGVQSFEITITDNIAPVISGIPANITQDLDAGTCGAIVNWTLPTASDNCSISSLSSSHNPGDVFPSGTTTVTYTATDDSGNTDVQSFDITIIDDIAPVISGMPSDITQDVDVGTCGAVVNWTLPTAADNCGITNMSSSHNPEDVFPAGTTTVTYTATDNSGNTDVQSFEITITDNIAPVISGMPSDITQNTDDGICGAKVSWTSPLVNDNCDATVTASHNPGDIFNPGTTTVTYVATDTQGNSVSSSFDVTVIDISAPVISGIPTGIVQNTDIGACGAIVSWDEPDATDNCSATLTSSHTPGDFFDIGETTVVYTASDPYGNMKSASFTVKIEDNNILEFSSCPSIYVIESIDTVQKFAIISWDVPSVNTSCSEVTVSSNYQPGQIFNYGTFTVTYIAKDENGNEATCSFDVSSGYNRSPMVRNSARKATPGETISVVIDAVDPDGHQLIIKSIENNKNNSVISSINYQNLTFEYTPFDNFFGRDTVSIVISDDGSPPSSVVALLVFEVEQPLNVEVSSAITTNGDMINDQWQLRNIERYPNNSVYIYDRWGGLIYHDKGYDNQSVVWSGNINRSGREPVPTGTYFYVINLGDGYGKLTGAVEVIR